MAWTTCSRPRVDAGTGARKGNPDTGEDRSLGSELSGRESAEVRLLAQLNRRLGPGFTVAAATEALGLPFARSSQNAGWSASGPESLMSVMVDVAPHSGDISWVNVSFSQKLRVTLKELAPLYGDYRVLSREKTSWITFDPAPNTFRVPVGVVVHLFSSPSEDTLVTRVLLRILGPQ